MYCTVGSWANGGSWQLIHPLWLETKTWSLSLIVSLLWKFAQRCYRQLTPPSSYCAKDEIIFQLKLLQVSYIVLLFLVLTLHSSLPFTPLSDDVWEDECQCTSFTTVRTSNRQEALECWIQTLVISWVKPTSLLSTLYGHVLLNVANSATQHFKFWILIRTTEFLSEENEPLNTNLICFWLILPFICF